MSRKNQVPTPASAAKVMMSLANQKKLERIVFDLSQRHNVTVSTSFVLHTILEAVDAKAKVAELAGAAK